jgi:hypothetical protein
LSPSPKALAQIGLCEQSLHRWIDSEGHLAEALRDKDHPWINDNRLHLENAANDVANHIGSLMLKGGVPGAAVYVGDSNKGTLPLPAPLRIDKEQVDIQIVAPGGRQPVFAPNVKIKPRDVVLLDVDALAAAAGQGSASSPDLELKKPLVRESASTWKRPTGYALLGVGVASAAVGTVLLFKPPTSPAGCPGLPAGYECSQQQANFVPGAVFLGAGAALAITGGLVLSSSPKTELALTGVPSQLLVFRGPL